MQEEGTTEWIARQLHRALDESRSDLDRIELLTAAWSAFSKPIPEYEPTFHHLGSRLRQHEIEA